MTLLRKKLGEISLNSEHALIALLFPLYFLGHKRQSLKGVALHSLTRNFILVPYDQEYKLGGVFLELFCKQPHISSDVWLFYLLSYPQYKPCFSASWIPLTYSILTVQVMANSYRQSKRVLTDQVGMLPSTTPLCEESCPFHTSQL